jgi:hypothetical protein
MEKRMTNKTPADAIKTAATKAHQCELERVNVETQLRDGFRTTRADAKADFFKKAIDGLKLDLTDYGNLAINYQKEDAAGFNESARIARVGKFVQDKCFGK